MLIRRNITLQKMVDTQYGYMKHVTLFVYGPGYITSLWPIAGRLFLNFIRIPINKNISVCDISLKIVLEVYGKVCF